MAFLIAIYLKRRIAANIMFLASTVLASTVLAKRGSRAVFGYVSKLVTVKTTNDRFFVLFTVVFTKNINPLY